MAIEKKRMQQRYGTYQQFQDNINNLLPNEFASVTSGDPNTVNGEGLYFQCGSNTPKRILTEEDKSLPVVTVVDINSDNNHIPTAKAVADALSTKAPASTAYTFDTTTTNVVYNANNPKTIYLNATVDGENGIVLTSADNYCQYFFGSSKSIKTRNKNGASTYTDWELTAEKAGNKKNSITASNKTSTEYYPSLKAVVDYLAANYENMTNKLDSETGIDEQSTDTEYPTAKAVYDFGADILTEVVGDLVLKERLSNKKNAIAGNETSEQYYPTTKAVYDYGSQISSAVEDVKAYIGYTSGDILGLHADFENNVFTRLGAAVGKTAGTDFNTFDMYGQRRRVVVTSDGEIQTDMDPAEITETDFDYDVMVYQPKFYYKVVPLKLEKQSGGLGYHIRKANYYITSTPHAGFKLHPLFYDKNGNEVDYVLFSAYEASYMYWHATSQSTGYYDIFHDGVDTDTTIETSAVLKSLPGVKPISGQYKAMNKANLENCALRKSPNWHLDTIQSAAANQLLMAIELGTFNTQAAIGQGVVSCPSNGSYNCSSYTGSTASLGNATGMATETTYESAGTETVNTTNGKLSVTYRGVENPWGNIWKHTNGINLWSDGHMGGGQVFICDDFSFNESKHDGNYQSAGFTVSNGGGYVSAFGYGDEDYDWLFMPSETTGNSSLPVGDNFRCTSNLNGYRIAPLGGGWNGSSNAGGFCWYCYYTLSYRDSYVGGRLLFVPTASV